MALLYEDISGAETQGPSLEEYRGNFEVNSQMMEAFFNEVLNKNGLDISHILLT